MCNDSGEDDNHTEDEDTNNQNLVTHDTNEEATENITLEQKYRQKEVLKLFKIGLWQVGFYNLSGFGYDACPKGVARKKYLDIMERFHF